MKEYQEITINSKDPVQLEMLTALLPELGFHGMEETDEGFKAYAEAGQVNQAELKALMLSMGLSFEMNILKEENWNASWESNFDPVIIPGKIHIRANFHPKLEGIEHSIEITPKMSFGTGPHATTKMMMLEMLDMDFKGKKVFDFGTGTGVLAILAKKLGAEHVRAVDNDQWSIDNAIENFQRNDCTGIDISLQDNLKNEAIHDILLANIIKHVLIEQVTDMRTILKPDGILIISGLLSDDYDDIESVFCPLFGKITHRSDEGNWIALRF